MSPTETNLFAAAPNCPSLLKKIEKHLTKNFRQTQNRTNKHSMGDNGVITIRVEEYVQLLLLKDKVGHTQSIADQLTKDNEILKNENEEMKKKYEETCVQFVNKIEEEQTNHLNTMGEMKKKIEEKQMLIDKERIEKMQINYECTMLKLRVNQLEKEVNIINEGPPTCSETKMPRKTPDQSGIENLKKKPNQHSITTAVTETELNQITEPIIAENRKKRVQRSVRGKREGLD